MNKISPISRRCLLLLLLALLVAWDSTAQGLESRIVFSSNRDGDWDIYSMDINGNNLVQLTDHPASDEYPACSPDGRRIVFISDRGITGDLYVMDSDGTNVIRLTGDNFVERRPSWTPDGTRIAFSSLRWVVGNREIYVMGANGNNLINLTKHEMEDIDPAWSPDGRKIAFVSFRDGGLNDPFHIFVMNADGKGRRNLTGDTVLANARSSNPTWSPDGSKIAFGSQRFFEGFDIYVITAEGKNLNQLTLEGTNRMPAFSPDGRKIAFASNRDEDFNIYLMDNHGMNVVKLTRTPPGVDNISPSWLPSPLAVYPNGKLPTSWGGLKRTGNP